MGELLDLLAGEGARSRACGSTPGPGDRHGVRPRPIGVEQSNTSLVYGQAS